MDYAAVHPNELDLTHLFQHNLHLELWRCFQSPFSETILLNDWIAF